LQKANALTVSLVAEAVGKIVAHIAISPVSISDRSTGWFGLDPVPVLPGYQRQGIGSRLIKQALSALKNKGASGCVVLGDPAYYGHAGFKVRPGLVLPWVPAEYFQALCFISAIPRGRSGLS
jgi:putative acetyltransferase